MENGNIYDLIIVGGGPAGLTAAIYARRADHSVLILERAAFGGQITQSPKVENIPGFLSLSGNEFADKLVEQAMEQGADVELCEALEIRDGDPKIVVTDVGEFAARSVIVATGAAHRRLGLPREEDFIGNGISFCAVCDGAFYKNRTVAVIGGGNSALQEALLLADQCAKVTVVQNLDFLTGEKRLCDELYTRKNVEILLGTVADAFLGDPDLTGLRVKRVADGETRDLKVDGVFVAIGLIPQNEPFGNLLPLDRYGYAAVDESCKTGTPGVFVAGDCRSKRIRQVTTAAADGAVAALAAGEYLKGIR